MEWIRTLLEQQPVVTLFLTIALGYLVGQISIKGFSLGVGAMRGGWIDRKAMPRGPNGRGLCRWCSLEVPRGRYTFCSQFCVHEWKLRSQPAYLREQVFDRDRGMCACCHIDTITEARKLRYARGTNRDSLLAHWGLRRRSRKSLWDADHIIPVIEGGAVVVLGCR